MRRNARQATSSSSLSQGAADPILLVDMILLTGIAVVRQPPMGTVVEWGAFAYLAAVSMFLGFFAWYRGLAIGPMSQVSQVQLTQPVMNILWAAMLLGEHIGWQTVTGGIAVIGCALLAVRARNRGKQAGVRNTLRAN